MPLPRPRIESLHSRKGPASSHRSTEQIWHARGPTQRPPQIGARIASLFGGAIYVATSISGVAAPPARIFAVQGVSAVCAGLTIVVSVFAIAVWELARSARHARERQRLEAEKHEFEQKLNSALAASEAEKQALRESKARLHASEARFAAIFRANPIATTLGRVADASVVDVNDAYLTMSGFTRDAVIGRNSVELGLWHSMENRAEMIAKIRAEGAQTIEATVHWKSGRVRVVIASFELIQIEGEDYVLGMWRDITERRQAEQKLRASEERFREVVETISEVFWIIEQPGRHILYLSPSFEQLWGIPVEAASTRACLECVHPADRARVKAAIANPALASDETFRIVRPDESVRWVRARGYPVRDAQGNVCRTVGVADDITEKKQLESRFLHAQRLEAVGTLASGLAHEMNNVLAPFMVVPDLLKASCPGAEERELLRMLEDTARRGSGVIRQLLTFSRGSDGEYGPLLLESLIDDLLQMLRATFPREISLCRQLPPRLAVVNGNATQIHQVLLNLCLNARDAMPEGGVLTIQAEETVVGREAEQLHPDARPGPYVVIAIRDTGKGIPPEIFERIFDPFFTTKQNGAGTGLGLSTASSIAKSHGGFMTVDSEVNRGAVFRVHLPVTDDACPHPQPLDRAPIGRGDGELLLVVDDDDPIRTTLAHLLEQQGYRVATASDRQEALGVLAAERNSVRVMITDFMMPNGNGAALISDVRLVSPKLPIIAMTGTVDAGIRQQLAGLGISRILGKPFVAREIIESVRVCVDSDSSR